MIEHCPEFKFLKGIKQSEPYIMANTRNDELEYGELYALFDAYKWGLMDWTAFMNPLVHD